MMMSPAIPPEAQQQQPQKLACNHSKVGGALGRLGAFKFLAGAKNSIIQLGNGKKRKKMVSMSQTRTDTYEGDESSVSMDAQPVVHAVPSTEPASMAPEASPPSPTPMVVDGAGPLSSRLICGYEILDTLGKGMSGKVKRGRCPLTGKYVALKIIDKNQVPRRILNLLNTEIQAMQTLRAHPNILTLLHCEGAAMYPKKDGTVRDVVCLALELASGGELFDYLMYTGAFGEEISKAIFIQLASALAYCHDYNIYHRDIKPENLLLDEHFQLKLADFGLSAIRADPAALLRTECGTRSYMAPEVLAHLQYDGKKADCWSAGVVLFIMLSGNPPFQMARPGDWWFNQVKDGKYDRFWASHLRYNPNFPRGAQALLNRMFITNPAQRPTLRDVLLDPWLTSCHLTPMDIQMELSRRKETATQAKAAEMERARQKKAAGHVGGQQREYHPDTHKNRAVAHEEHQTVVPSGSPEYSDVEAPVASAKVLAASCMTSLYSAEPATYCLRRLRETVALMGGEIVTKGSEMESRFKMVAIIPMNGNKVEVEVRLWSVAEGDITLIQVVRREGDLLAFHSIFNKLREETKDLHGEDEEEADPEPFVLHKLDVSRMPEPLDSEDDEVRERSDRVLDTSGRHVAKSESLLGDGDFDMI